LTYPNLYELWRLRLFSFGGYGLALAALALVVFGAIECPPSKDSHLNILWENNILTGLNTQNRRMLIQTLLWVQRS